jgi:tetratricopeptide (TPR) repeat protein
LCALRKTILDNHIPTESQWLDALLEQWRLVPGTVEEPQKFFKLPEGTARKHLTHLAKSLADECAKHDPLFKIGTTDGIRNANTGINEIKTKLDEILQQLEPGITNDTKLAIEKIFLTILRQKDIPQWQWPEKLQEITKRHQELLEKWNSVQSGDPEVDTFRNKARQMIELGDYDNADQLLQKAVAIDRKAIKSQQERLDNRKLSMSQSLASRAKLAETKLDYKKAIDLCKEALAILPQNQQTIQAVYLNNLALLYHTVANYKEAEPLYQRALAIDETSLGKDHPNVARALNNLAGLYQDTNRLAEAEPLMKRVVEIVEKSLGKDHPNVAKGLSNLAALYQATNRLSQAEPLMKRALAIWEKFHHPLVATALNNLAMLYKDTNRLSEAEPLMKRAVEILENPGGEPLPNYAGALNNLAQLYQNTNRLAEAEQLMKRGLEIEEKSKGKNHPHVAIQLNNLAALYQVTNRLFEAEPMFKRALAIDEASFGKDHPNVAIRLNNLAQLYKATNRLADAESLMKRVVEILLQFTRRTGHPHPHLKAAINNYSVLLRQMGFSEDEITDRLKRLAPEIFKQEQ